MGDLDGAAVGTDSKGDLLGAVELASTGDLVGATVENVSTGDWLGSEVGEGVVRGEVGAGVARHSGHPMQ